MDHSLSNFLNPSHSYLSDRSFSHHSDSDLSSNQTQPSQTQFLSPPRDPSQTQSVTNSHIHPVFLPVFSSIPPGDPLLIIDIIKSSLSLCLITTRFLVTPFGMIYSQRNSSDGDITIGRKSIENGKIANDIVIHPSDEGVSRKHARIIYKHGLFKARKVPEDFLSLCMMSHPRIGKFSYGRKIPLSIYRLIFEFLKEKKRILIEDLGSTHGTFIRVQEAEEITEGTDLLLGKQALVTVLETYKSGFEYFKRRLGVATFQALYNQEEDLTRIFWREFGNAEVHSGGYLNFEESSCVWKILSGSFLLLWSGNPFAFSRSRQGQYHVLFFPENVPLKFQIGSHPQSSIEMQKALSAVLFYLKDGKFFVKETGLNNFGLQSGESYGVWRSVSAFNEGKEKYEVRSKELKNGDEVRISETVLKVTWDQSIDRANQKK